MNERGWVIMHPQGSPENRNSWKKYGPGAIVKPGSTGEVYVANQIIGTEGVNAAMADRDDYPLENVTSISSYNVNLDGNVTGILDTKDKNLFKRIGAQIVNISYGNTYQSSPYALSEIADKFNKTSNIAPIAKKALRLNQAHLVEDVLYTSSVSYVLGRYNQNNVFVPITISQEARAQIEAGGYRVSGSSLTSEKPIFIAYRPADKQWLNLR